VINALGHVSTTVYDAAGRAAAALDPLGFRTTLAYDAANRPVAQTDPLGHRTTSVYDAAGRLIATVNPLGARTTFSYDAAGRQQAILDANGNAATTVYDELGRNVAQISALGHRTTTVYDAAGRRIGILDANGGRNTYTHDAAGRIVQHLDALGRATTFAYDAAGRQTSILDARGIEATFQYDAANRLTSRTSTNDPPVTFGYDAVGNRTEAIDGTGRSTFTYDLLGRRLTAVDPAGNAITYTSDALGQRATMTAPNGGVFTYAYGPRAQIAHLVNPQGDRTTFSYDAAGQRTLTELANGTRASYTYDGASRVAQLYNLKADDSVIVGLTYQHDTAGNPVGMVESSGDRVTWTYDATDRLTREQRSGAVGYDTTYTYDPLGNRLLKDASGALTTYAYDLANQLTTSQNATGVTTYTYDLAGNLQVVEQPTGQRTTNTWDDQNRQTSVLMPAGGIVTSAYRFDGLRHEKAEPQSVTKYIWDFQNYLAETDQQDDIQAIYTNEPQPYGNLISQYRKGPTIWVPSYCKYDALGSARVLTDWSGDATDTYLYDAWGNEVAVSGTTINPLRWVGRVGYYWDEGTGTFYIRARMYDPVGGRWMSADPLLYPIPVQGSRWNDGSHLDRSLLTEIYVYANPLRWIDPTGMETSDSEFVVAYVKSKCKLSCGCLGGYWLTLGMPGVTTIFQEVRNFAEAEAGRYVPSAGFTPAIGPKDLDADGSLNYYSRLHSALRHCIAGGTLASRSTCRCSRCALDEREIAQWINREQPAVNTRQAIWNNREGRKCARCTAANASNDPLPSVAYPDPHAAPPGFSSKAEIVSCCTKRLESGSLATSSTITGTELNDIFPMLPPQNTRGLP
jgi:RHS repeat-associated protein